MKRSDVERIIWEAINELEDANHILKRLEDIGMLPPLAAFNREQAGYGQGSMSWTVEEHKWEPENG